MNVDDCFKRIRTLKELVTLYDFLLSNKNSDLFDDEYLKLLKSKANDTIYLLEECYANGELVDKDKVRNA